MECQYHLYSKQLRNLVKGWGRNLRWTNLFMLKGILHVLLQTEMAVMSFRKLAESDGI